MIMFAHKVKKGDEINTQSTLNPRQIFIPNLAERVSRPDMCRGEDDG